MSNIEQSKIENRVRIGVHKARIRPPLEKQSRMFEETQEQRSEPLDESVQPAGWDKKVEIAALAYLFWQERGCLIGSDQQDWFRAERELVASKKTGDEVRSDSSVERSIAYAEEANPLVLRFPVRSELQESRQRAARRT